MKRVLISHMRGVKKVNIILSTGQTTKPLRDYIIKINSNLDGKEIQLFDGEYNKLDLDTGLIAEA